MANDSVDHKLDLILTSIGNLSSKFDRLDGKVTALQTISDTHGQAIADLQREVIDLKEAGNARDQASRGCVVRVFNIPVSVDESADNNKVLAGKVYDRVLKPVLAAAKAKGDISVLPQATTVIEDCFRTRAKGGVAPIIVKLSSSKLKTIIMRNKKENIPAPSRAEAAAGVLAPFVVEDLTQDDGDEG